MNHTIKIAISTNALILNDSGQRTAALITPLLILSLWLPGSIVAGVVCLRDWVVGCWLLVIGYWLLVVNRLSDLPGLMRNTRYVTHTWTNTLLFCCAVAWLLFHHLSHLLVEERVLL